MGIVNYFVFDDIDTRDYSGIYVSFSNVDKTPKRSYDVVEIPARNGAFYIDKQRFEDVEHSYYVIALTKAIGSQFINDLASKVGYHRLEDSFNTDEFYSAVFTSGADVKITQQRDKNTFKVTFTRKPQRWLTSGETATSVADGGTITNPTPFDSSPLLEVSGLGNIELGTQTITIQDVYIGEIVVANGGSFLNGNYSPQSTTFTIDDSLLNGGDVIKLDHIDVNFGYAIPGISPQPAGGIEFVSGTNLYLSGSTVKGGANKLTTTEASFAYGTSSTFTATANCKMTISNVGYSYTITITIAYDGADGMTITVSDNGSANLPAGYKTRYKGNTYSDVIGDSTVSALGSVVYIDLDIGEAYNLDYGEPVSVNNAVNLGSDLPTLPPGATTVNYDNTITDLKIAPRWWKV